MPEENTAVVEQLQQLQLDYIVATFLPNVSGKKSSILDLLRIIKVNNGQIINVSSKKKRPDNAHAWLPPYLRGTEQPDRLHNLDIYCLVFEEPNYPFQ